MKTLIIKLAIKILHYFNVQVALNLKIHEGTLYIKGDSPSFVYNCMIEDTNTGILVDTGSEYITEWQIKAKTDSRSIKTGWQRFI